MRNRLLVAANKHTPQRCKVPLRTSRSSGLADQSLAEFFKPCRDKDRRPTLTTETIVGVSQRITSVKAFHEKASPSQVHLHFSFFLHGREVFRAARSSQGARSAQPQRTLDGEDRSAMIPPERKEKVLVFTPIDACWPKSLKATVAMLPFALSSFARCRLGVLGSAGAAI